VERYGKNGALRRFGGTIGGAERRPKVGRFRDAQPRVAPKSKDLTRPIGDLEEAPFVH
jgi:hypothetical protein